MFFVGGEEALRFLIDRGLLGLDAKDLLFLYPVKAVSVGLMLVLFSRKYTEVRVKDIFKASHTGLSILTGVIVFALWINMDWGFATFGNPGGYNPKAFENNFTGDMLVVSRIFGAVVVVPVMEEIFWRSFLIRYIISADFMKIPIGHFTWGSFILTAVLFGLEHSLYLAGIMAGAAYNLLLYRTKSISQCIIAHAVSNLALGIYVLHTGQWQFW